MPRKKEETKSKDTVFASIKLTKEEYGKLEEMKKEAEKKGIRLTFKDIINKAFQKGIELAEKEIEEIKKERKKSGKKN
ncbi:MAG: hypothetical protein M1576_04255 [Deltaproteobacteria bacterium]|jgi:hypothetical protein|uniref:Uncharacterized protein n=1 Tax=Candidatus Acididesulfobacter diazotrophicus TaxID=2597226 RepID=A0A519BJT8_9DELT|nr:hypothetical protein [Deltaproteobacteria bacterium]RZD17533.1 MAG: hypothetical protein EVG15_10690 [Candidatus Acididesulfobacter diazotrophicus]